MRPSPTSPACSTRPRAIPGTIRSRPRHAPPRASAGDALVSKTRITPHWFHQNNRFWYRNDLAGGKREFILVDTEAGTREPAFDHQKLAAALCQGERQCQSVSADKLPFDAIDFADDLKSVRFRVGETTWRCDLGSYECARSEHALPATPPDQAATLIARARLVAARIRAIAPGASETSPDKKWTAFIKDHNVFLKREGQPGEIKLSDDGKEGLAYVRLQWAPDSKTVVSFRIEPGDRKEVYLIQSSPPGGGRAQLRSRPYPLPGDKFAAYELNSLRRRIEKGQQAQGRPHRFRTAASALAQGRPPFHVRKDRPRPSAIPLDRSRFAHRRDRAT